jgi:uncharacterized protein (DUF1697 family)
MTTYIALLRAVNVGGTGKKVQAQLEKRLLIYAGKAVGAFVRTADEMRIILKRNPFSDREPKPLYHTHRFLNRDYIVFDCGGMAFSEAGFHASIAIVR